MIEDELRTTFARHEDLVPDAALLGPAIDAGVRRVRRRRAVWTSVTAACAALVVTAGPVLVPHLLRDRYAPGVGTAAGGGTRAAAVTGPLNLLVLGLDRRPGQAAADPVRADTIMIMHIPASHDRGYLVSIPRDLLVDIPGHGRDKINAAYAFGGADLARKAVENLTGLTVDGTAEMRFEGLSRLTDALGGVPMCLDQRVVSIHTDRVFEPGCQRLSGDQALDLLRQRYGLPGGALDRDRHARQFIAALLDEAGHTDLLTNPVTLDRVLRAVGDAMTLTLPRFELVDLVAELRDLPDTRLDGDEVPVVQDEQSGVSALTATPKAAELFAALRDDNIDRWLAHRQLMMASPSATPMIVVPDGGPTR
ncbi:LCP family protein [Planosporangium sp. 12N6]|uniref:LCP family protein n=1 Tax=Planosporangium spinosum TaxID=3402278 RepID=UPI003CECF782